MIAPEIQEALYAYIGAIVKNQSGHLMEIGGTSNHVHLLVALANLDKFSELIRAVKASSSLWIHKNYPHFRDFAWQEGFGSFTVSFSAVKSVQKYIQGQEEHHKKVTFEQEYLEFLKRHQISFDERFVLG